MAFGASNTLLRYNLLVLPPGRVGSGNHRAKNVEITLNELGDASAVWRVVRQFLDVEQSAVLKAKRCSTGKPRANFVVLVERENLTIFSTNNENAIRTNAGKRYFVLVCSMFSIVRLC